MANPNFIPDYSTNQIYIDQDMSECLTDKLEDMDDAISGKAESSHTHTGYASATHEHTDYAPVSHEHTDYASQAHTHTEYAGATHTHAQSEISGLEAALNDKASTSHTHSQSEVTGLSDALAGKADANHTHTDYAASAHEHSDYAGVEHSHTVFPSATSTASYKLVYIATNGSDDNDGFTQATAMATIKGVIKKYADSYKALDIRLLNGTYNEDTWSISVDQCNLSIRSATEDKDAVVLNLTGNIETNVNKLRLYNMTINVTNSNVRAVSVTAGSLYAYNVRFNVPENSDASCVNVYNGSCAFLMNCVLNAGTGSTAGGAVYGNQALCIKAINCTSERTVSLGFHAHNGSDIYYTDTLTATTKVKETFYGKCTVRA